MKTVTVTMTLMLTEDQPLVDWLPDAITQLLTDSESLLSYSDNEPTLAG